MKNNGFKLLAADIPFHYRYLYNNNIGGCLTVKGEEIAKDGWSCKVIDAKEITESDNFESDFRIMSFDIENSIFERTIYCISYCV